MGLSTPWIYFNITDYIDSDAVSDDVTNYGDGTTTRRRMIDERRFKQKKTKNEKRKIQRPSPLTPLFRLTKINSKTGI